MRVYSVLLLCWLVAAGGGERSSTERIVNGITADETTPIIWQVYIRIDAPEGIRTCGGVILSPTHVVTAAHCFRTFVSRSESRTANAKAATFCTGKDRTKCIQTTRGEDVWIHPTFLPDQAVENATDLAVVTINPPLQFLDLQVGALPLADASCTTCEQPGSVYLTSGYGLQATEGEGSPTLQYMQSAFVPREDCQLSAVFSLPSGSVCADGADGAAVCQGDSGGGLAHFNQQQSRWVLVGVVFTGTDIRQGQLFCGEEQSNQYDVYVSVMSEYAWLNASLFNDIGPPTATEDFVVPAVAWYEWVPPLVGGILAIILFVLLAMSCRKRSSAMNAALEAGQIRHDDSVVGVESELVGVAHQPQYAQAEALTKQYGAIDPYGGTTADP